MGLRAELLTVIEAMRRNLHDQDDKLVMLQDIVKEHFEIERVALDNEIDPRLWTAARGNGPSEG